MSDGAPTAADAAEAARRRTVIMHEYGEIEAQDFGVRDMASSGRAPTGGGGAGGGGAGGSDDDDLEALAASPSYNTRRTQRELPTVSQEKLLGEAQKNKMPPLPKWLRVGSSSKWEGFQECPPGPLNIN